ncbi:hexosaminidase D-like isoform X2 [Maniola jurtina]|nr:hexosaminidase D-like isoform X2 [Maniola jurtina]XP_045780430.1 hexosaminidase D-like isoform X2 [Maniola jurtina]XP_045780431.1 hexosaminidase D-like isoform X2 [Maniola jurtina]XP_045780432.1 hexosaminidase D-like isoform X2 [Maniola jurtina]XP_045780433.1 hexosaminidase D-like isoform X2 [Maniola jurtina]
MFQIFKKCRRIKINFFMISLILFSMYLFVSYSLVQKLMSKSTNHKIQVHNTAVTLPNVVIHLDLKGSPPKLGYLKRLLPQLHELGVTGFLIEYEDMFPYEGPLANLKARNAYRKSELQDFLKMVVNLGFDIIPLIQTFGHMEHVLKLKQFEHLREVPLHSNVICPSKSESQILIKNMLKQVIQFHRNIFQLNYFHIGADEVYHINKCKQCLQRNQTNATLFLNHVKFTTDFIKKISPQTTVLMWEDMLRTMSMPEWGIVKNLRVEPVYWNYQPRLKVSHVALNMYHKKFDNIWIASAFKGADGMNATVPNIKKRFSNHLSWMELIQNYKFGGEQDIYSFKGIILTGWSRYFHNAPPCELLPVSIPSLFLNLLLIQHFKRGNDWVECDNLSDFFNKNLNDDFTALLRCTDPIEIDYFDVNQCYFDGIDLYKTLNHCDRFVSYISKTVKDILQKSTAFYNNDIDTDDQHIKWSKKTLNDLVALEDKMVKQLSRYYNKHFVAEYVNHKLMSSQQMMYMLLENENYMKSTAKPPWVIRGKR